MTEPASDATLARVRRMVLALAAAGVTGLVVELALLAHFEDFKQYIPFAAAGVSLGALAWHALAPRAASARAVRAAMALMILTGLAGVVLHCLANMEFQAESDPSLAGVALVAKALRAKAPPALAPVNRALLGLLGLAGVYRDRSR